MTAAVKMWRKTFFKKNGTSWVPFVYIPKFSESAMNDRKKWFLKYLCLILKVRLNFFLTPKLQLRFHQYTAGVSVEVLRVIYDTLHTLITLIYDTLHFWQLLIFHTRSNFFSLLPLLIYITSRIQIQIQMQLVANVDMDMYASPQGLKKKLN